MRDSLRIGSFVLVEHIIWLVVLWELKLAEAIGIPLYFAQALSVALYTIGFAESRSQFSSNT